MSKEIYLAQDTIIVSQTNERGEIVFANTDFCKIAGYSLEELIGLPHNLVRHKDTPKWAFEDLWKNIKNGKIWKGIVKNRTNKIAKTINNLANDLENSIQLIKDTHLLYGQYNYLSKLDESLVKNDFKVFLKR